MKVTGLARLGRDAELRHIPSGDAVVNLSLAFAYGKKGADGYRPTQWVEAALFGKRAESLAPYLAKGGLVVAYLSDLHLETYEGKNGTGTKLVARVDDLELCGEKPQQSEAPQKAATPKNQTPANSPGSVFEDMDDDIPF